MIHDHERSGWFGASDTGKIVGSWETPTFEKWWMVKLGIRQEDFTTDAMLTGTAFEHRIWNISASGKWTVKSEFLGYVFALIWMAGPRTKQRDKNLWKDAIL